MKSANSRADSELGGSGDWIAAVIVWFAALSMFLAIVCFLLRPTQ